MKLKDLNGWQRLWVVVAGCTLLCAWLWVLQRSSFQPWEGQAWYEPWGVFLVGIALWTVFWAIGMGLLYFAGTVVAWVRRGFTRKT